MVNLFDADKLKVTKVSVGFEQLQIVCGAPNVAVGQKVVVATVGCTLYPKPDQPFKIKNSKIRGVESQGMLCAEDELGIGNSHDGILVLDSNAKVGTPAAQYFELEDDYQLEIGLTPNRADAMGHIGVARDLIAYLNVHRNLDLKLKIPEIQVDFQNKNDLPIEISIEEPTLCPRYVGVSLKNCKVQASPAWLQKRLRSVGLSPINNIVDCTNFVMRELGTPLHAFDTNRLNGKIVVKKAEKGEVFTTLDGVRRTLDENNLMITNGKENLAIAGVFGGLDSGITDNTKNIFIESAYFNPVSIRKTAKFHGLNTDASFRYERGVDPNMTIFALKRVVELIQKVAGGAVGMDVLDCYPSKIESVIVDFRISKCHQLIGFDIDENTIEKIVSNLDIKIIKKTGDLWKLEIPAYRVDVHREVDVVEEVLRIYGFNKIPIPEKLNASITYISKPEEEKVQHIVSELLVGLGFSEMLNNSLQSSDYIEKLGGETFRPEENVSILNPLSKELCVMRQSLLFNVLEVVAHNQNRQNSDLKLFEFGKIYKKSDNKFIENKQLSVALCGDKFPAQWNHGKEKSNFFTIKGVLESVLNRLGLLSFLEYLPVENSILEDGQNLKILNENIGQIGWISNSSKKYFGIKNDIFILDLNWDALLRSLKLNRVVYQEIPKTFEVRRDYSLLLDEKVMFSDIENTAKKVDKKILKKIGLFDVYEGENLEKGKKSYAVSFHFQDKNETLKDAQVDVIMEKIRIELEEKYTAQLR
jgi:phenylalanyl-tRNA synthetase beta chain